MKKVYVVVYGQAETNNKYSYDEESDLGYLLVVDTEYPKTLRM